MSQTNPEIDWDAPGSVALPRLDEVLTAMRSSYSGSMSPVDAQQGQMWVDTSPTGFVTIKVYYTGVWIAVYHVYSVTDVRLASQATANNIVRGIANKYPDSAAVKSYVEANFSDKSIAAVGDAGLVEKATAANLTAGEANKYPDSSLIKTFVEESGGGLIGAPVIFKTSGTYSKNPLAKFMIVKMYGAGGKGANRFHYGRNTFGSGAGGGGGEYVEKTIIASTLPASISLVIGTHSGADTSLGLGAALLLSAKNGSNGTEYLTRAGAIAAGFSVISLGGKNGADNILPSSNTLRSDGYDSTLKLKGTFPESSGGRGGGGSSGGLLYDVGIGGRSGGFDFAGRGGRGQLASGSTLEQNGQNGLIIIYEYR